MAHLDLLIFDLDGTLIDSKLDLAHAVNAMRKHMDRDPLPHELIFSYVGNGAPVLVRRALGPGASDAEVDAALAFFQSYYYAHCLDHTSLYAGVRDVLDAFHRRRIAMAVLTNKPIAPTQAIIDGLKLDGHFFRVYGGNSFNKKKPDPIGVDRLIEEASVTRQQTLMIGDSAVDVRTARNAGIRVVGLTYGFQPESLIADPPDVLLHRIEDLMAVVGSA